MGWGRGGGGGGGEAVPSSSSSLKNSSLSLAEWDFFISAMRLRGALRRSDGEKKDGRLRSGVGGVLNDVTWGGAGGQRAVF